MVRVLFVIKKIFIAFVFLSGIFVFVLWKCNYPIVKKGTRFKSVTVAPL